MSQTDTSGQEVRPAWWPAPQQELLLRATILKGEDARLAWSDWVELVDFDNLDVESNRLIPSTYSNLAPLGLEHELMPRMKGIKRHAWLKNRLLLQETADFVEQMRPETGPVGPIVAGDAAVTVGFSKDIGTRPIRAVDILLDGDVPAAAEDGNPAIRPHGRSSCELWEVSFENSARENIGDTAIGIPEPAVLLVQIISEGLRSFPSPKIQWVYDVCVILQSGKPIDWDRFVDVARRQAYSWKSIECFRYLQRKMEFEPPDGLLDRLSSDRRLKMQRREFELRYGDGERSFLTRLALVRLGFHRYAGVHPVSNRALLWFTYLSDRWGKSPPPSPE